MQMDIDQEESAGFSLRGAAEGAPVGVRRKGRGFGGDRIEHQDGIKFVGAFDRHVGSEAVVSPDSRSQRSIEGWVIFVSGLHDEASEEEVAERFAEYGQIRNIHLNLDRRTGYVKGYALIEYETLREAQLAVDSENSQEMYGRTLLVDFAFLRPADVPSSRSGTYGAHRQRSRSPSYRRR